MIGHLSTDGCYAVAIACLAIVAIGTTILIRWGRE